MDISIKPADEVKVLGFKGKLDTQTSPDAQEQLIGLIENGEKKILVNFENLDFISSAGLRVLLMAAKKMKSSGGKLILCAMSEHVQEVFDIAGFTAVFNIEADRALAIDAGQV